MSATTVCSKCNEEYASIFPHYCKPKPKKVYIDDPPNTKQDNQYSNVRLYNTDPGYAQCEVCSMNKNDPAHRGFCSSKKRNTKDIDNLLNITHITCVMCHMKQRTDRNHKCQMWMAVYCAVCNKFDMYKHDEDYHSRQRIWQPDTRPEDTAAYHDRQGSISKNPYMFLDDSKCAACGVYFNTTIGHTCTKQKCELCEGNHNALQCNIFAVCRICKDPYRRVDKHTCKGVMCVECGEIFFGVGHVCKRRNKTIQPVQVTRYSKCNMVISNRVTDSVKCVIWFCLGAKDIHAKVAYATLVKMAYLTNAYQGSVPRAAPLSITIHILA